MDIRNLSVEVTMLRDTCNSQANDIRELVRILGNLTHKSVEVRNDIGSLSNKFGVYLG